METQKNHLDLFDRIASVLDNHEQLLQTISSMKHDDIAVLIEYLAKLRLTRDKCAKDTHTNFKQKHGCSSSYYYLKTDSEKYAKKLEENRMYKSRKRREAKLAESNAVQCV